MVVHTWGFVQSRPDSPWVKVELRAEPGAVFRVSGLPYAAALSSLARIRSALQSMDVRWPGKALTLHVHPALRAGEVNELDVPPQGCWDWTERPGFLARAPSKGFGFLRRPKALCAPWGHPVRFQPKRPSQCKKASTFLSCSACSSARPHFSNRTKRPLPRTLQVAGPTSKAKAKPKRGCASAPNSDCMPCWSVRRESANPHLSAQPTPCFLQTALSPSPFSRRTLPAAWADCSGLGDGVRLCQVHGHRLTTACCFSMNSRNGPGLQENRCGTSWTPALFICTGRKVRPIGPQTHGLWLP